MYIVENKKTGEKQCVDTLKGYPLKDFKVLEEGVTQPRGDCVRKDGRWKVDREKHADARYVRMTRRQIHDSLMEKIEALTRRVEALEAERVASGTVSPQVAAEEE